jgi:hypothetical protein
LSIDSLQTLLARRPLVWFFALTLGPAALSQVGGTNYSSLSLSFYLYTAGPIAALLCWAGDAEQRVARQTHKRGLIFLAVIIAVVPAIGYFYGGLPLLVDAAIAACYGYTICCLWSPVAAVRDLVRPLLRWRLSWSRYAFALLAWPLLAAAVVAASRLLPAQPSGGGAVLLRPFAGETTHLVLNSFVGELLLLFPWIVGCYGFAARRLLARHSPLVVGLLLGVVLSVAFWIPQAGDLARILAGSLSLAVVSLWLYERSRGGLLPLVVLQAAATASNVAVLFWAGPGFGDFRAAQAAFLVTQCLLAAVLVVGYRMWDKPVDNTPVLAVEMAL